MYVLPEFLIRSRPCSNYTVVLGAFFQPFKISQLMCTLMEGPVFACASWAAADSSHLTNYFFRHKDLRPDCVPTTPTSHNKLLGEKRPPDGAVPLRGGQLLTPESSEGHMTQQPASVLHEPTRRETDQTFIWRDRHRGHVGGTQRKNIIPHFPNDHCV